MLTQKKCERRNLKRFETREAAEAKLHGLNSGIPVIACGLAAQPCPDCEGWHLQRGFRKRRN